MVRKRRRRKQAALAASLGATLVCLFVAMAWPQANALLMDNEQNYAAASEAMRPANEHGPSPIMNSSRGQSRCFKEQKYYYSAYQDSSKLKQCRSDDYIGVEQEYRQAVTVDTKIESTPPNTVSKASDEFVPLPAESAGSEESSASSEKEERYIVMATPVHLVNEASSLSQESTSEEAVLAEEVSPAAPNQTGPPDTRGNQTEGANTTEQDIPSFREWRQKALEEEERKREEDKRKREEEKEKKKIQMQQQQQQLHVNHQHPPAAVHIVDKNATSDAADKSLKKNFASLDCGAKVISANPESQGAANIISLSRDEYMLNKCTDKVWFVVELCESIKAVKIEIANFELYSSVPHEFRVLLASSFPMRDKDSALFGHFFAEDDRSEQMFVSTEGVFGKYAKVEILSHHGNEHYCPISMFRIYGVSEIEMIGKEGDDDDDDDEGDGGLPVVPVQIPESKPNPSIVSYIKEKVDETIERVVGVFRPKDQIKHIDMNIALNASSLIGNTFVYSIACPNCDLDRFRDVYFLLSSNYDQLSGTLKNRFVRRSLEAWICSSYGFDFVSGEENSSTCMGYQLMDFYKTLFGSSRAIALCNVIAVERGLLPLARSQDIGPSPAAGSAAAAANGNRPAQPESAQSSITANASEAKAAETPSGSSEASARKEEGENSEKITATSEDGAKATADLASEHTTPPDESHSESQMAEGATASETISPTPVSGVPPPPASATANGEASLKDPPSVVHVAPSSSAQISPATNGQASQSQQLAQRETVWQKLSNKIKALERNVTLSSGYLEELSVRYKKQIEDLQLLVRQSAEALSATAAARDKNQMEIDELKERLLDLIPKVDNNEAQLITMSTWAIGIHVIFLLVEMIVGFLFLFTCIRRVKRAAVEATPLADRLLAHDVSRRNSVDALFPLAGANGVTSALSRRQRKRLQKRLQRLQMASLSRLAGDDHSMQQYHTFHPGDEQAAALMLSLRRSSDKGRPEVNPARNRFRVQAVDQLISGLPLGEVPTRNMFQALNGSVDLEDAGVSYASDNAGANDDSNGTKQKGTKQQRPRIHHRSKSTSPQRELLSQTALQKVMFRNFDPSKAEWIQQQQLTTKQN